MFYKYKVGWYNSYTDEELYSEGIVYATNYPSATDRVVDAYGKDQVFEMTIKELGTEEDDYCLSKEDIQYAFKED